MPDRDMDVAGGPGPPAAHGHRKMAHSAAGGFSIAPILAWGWDILDRGIPSLDMAMPPEVAAMIGAGITVLIMKLTREDRVV